MTEHRVSRCRVKIRGGSLLFLQRSFPACSHSRAFRLTIGSIDFSRLLRHFYRTVGLLVLIVAVEKRARLSLRGRTQMKMQTKITSKLKRARLVMLCRRCNNNGNGSNNSSFGFNSVT